MKIRAVAASLLLTLVSFAAQADNHDGILNANDATAEQIAALPMVNDTLAQAIVTNRPFATIGELHKLLSAALGEAQLEQLYSRLFVPIDLNSASEEDIMLIPGVGSKMAHEFEEYRPYSSMEQFRREIGKYVDEEEVARLEQYVTL